MMHLHPFCIDQGIPQLKKRDVRVLRNQLFKEGPMWCQFATITRATLRRRSRVPSGLDPAAPSEPRLLATVSNATPPRAHLNLLQCISETAPEALMAKVLT
jgi:hypothetical protein